MHTQWMNVGGKEKGKKNHFVVEQGDQVLELLDNAFKVFFESHPDAEKQQSSDNTIENDGDSSVGVASENGPELFIISPFNTVIEGMRQHLITNLTNPHYPTVFSHAPQVEDWLTDWRNVHIGTVHKFQGREANEVIFLLGCDLNSVRSTTWVKKNIVNVAVTRAKYRLVVVGDADVWRESFPMMEVKRLIDEYSIAET